MGVQITFNGIRILYVAQREYSRAIYPRQWRDKRQGSGGKQQFVIVLTIFSTIGFAHSYLFVGAIDGQHLTLYPNIQVQQSAEFFGCLHEKIFSLFDYPTYIIRQAAVGIRYILSFLEQDDFCFFVYSP